MDLTRLVAFSASFFLVAVSPGLCMTLAMSLGIRLGVRRTLWMMAGELAGIALVGALAMLGIAALLLGAPALFTIFKWAGAAYLVAMGWQALRAKPGGAERADGGGRDSRPALALQGFVTAVSNPKAWAFFAALLPPFIDRGRPLAPQMLALLAVIVTIEFLCLLLYASGGRALNEQLHRRGKAVWLNRVSGALMVGVALWLVLG